MRLTQDNIYNDSDSSSTGENGNEDEKWTSTFTDHDVLAIRGVGQNKNPGNLLFRDLVAARKSNYENNPSSEYRRQLGEEIVALIKPGRFLKKEDSSQKLFKIMDHHSSVTKATFAIRDLKVGIGGNFKRKKYKRRNKDPNHSNIHEDDASDVPDRRKRKGTSLPKTSSERKRKMTESIEMEKNNSTTSVTSKGSNQRSKPSISKNTQGENIDSSDLSDSDLESKASSRASLGSKRRLRKATNSSSTANQSPRKVVHHLKRSYAYKDLSDDDDDDHSDVKVIDLVPKLQSPFKRLKSLSPSNHKQEPKFAIPFRGYGFPLTVFIRTLTLVTENPTESANESITEVNDSLNLSDIDITASKELVALKHLKLRPL